LFFPPPPADRFSGGSISSSSELKSRPFIVTKLGLHFVPTDRASLFSFSLEGTLFELGLLFSIEIPLQLEIPDLHCV